MPLSDAMKVSPSIKKYVKDMLSNSFPSSEHNFMMVSEEVSAMIQERIPIKQPDHGSFVLDCNIHDEWFQTSLCDLGSSMNLIPYYVAVTLELTQFKPRNITLVLADRSVRIQGSVLEDVPIRRNESHIPTDFVVLNYGHEPNIL
ncbi:hypothetical protein Bca4012_065585 [Brassica carinata]